MYGRQSIFTLLFILCSIVAQARTSGITGYVTNEAGSPVAFANVILLRLPDSVLVKTELTDDSGKFTLDATAGNYIVNVLMLGYAPYTMVAVAQTDTQQLRIVLHPTGRELKEVSVRAQKPMIEVRPDKLVVNVENSILNAGNSVMDILTHSPGVTVDQNDNISLKGKQGVTIMIDGKIQPISAADMANLLKSMPSANIANIELISNPSARYDAAGTGGIINIKTKRDKRAGLNGSVNASYIQGIYGKTTGGFNLSMRNKKVSFFANYNGAYREGFNRLTLDRSFYTNGTFAGAYRQNNNYLYHITSHSGALGADVKITPKTVVGCNVTTDNTLFRRDGNNHSDIIDSATGKALSNFTTLNSSPNSWMNYAANINLRHNFDSVGKELAIDADFAAYPTTGTQYYNTAYYNYLPDGSSVPSATPAAIRHGNQDGLTTIRSLKLDYTDPLKNDARLEAGFKMSYVTADNDLKFYNKENGVLIPDKGRTNHFIYGEHINAAYLNYNREMKKWGAQLGLRAEQTIAEGRDVTIDSTFNRNYTQLFPSFAVQRHVTPNNDLGITLSRRIERPNYDQLNPFKYYLDPTTYKAGYPYMNPALSYSMELSHVFKQRFITTLNYTHTTAPIIEVIQPSPDEPKVTVQTTKNLNSMAYYGLSGSYQFTINKWWTNTTNFNTYYALYKGDIAGSNLNAGKVTFDIYTNNSLILPKNWSAEVSFFYQAPQVYGYMNLKPTSMLSAGIQKNFLDRRATIKANINDIFWTGFPRATSYYSNYTEYFSARRDTRQASLTFTYRFGQRGAGQRRRSGAEDEKRRVGGQGNS